jgi:epoxyqueuosine reductase
MRLDEAATEKVMQRLDGTCARLGVDEWGVAVNAGWPLAPDLPFAISLVGRHSPAALATIVPDHMSQAFFDDYSRLFRELDAAAAAIVGLLHEYGAMAMQTGNLMPGPNVVPDIPDWGDPGVFSHKIAATQAGLGWIGKTACFVSARFGTGVRLTSVFTDLELPTGEPTTESGCAGCVACVEACPVGAGRDVQWRAGLPRDVMYDEKACERQTELHPEWDGTCGVCQTVCPYTQRAVRDEPWRSGSA